MADDLSGNGTLAPTEYLGVTIDGSTVPVEVLGRRIDFEGSPAILAAVRDITERKPTAGNPCPPTSRAGMPSGA